MPQFYHRPALRALSLCAALILPASVLAQTNGNQQPTPLPPLQHDIPLLSGDYRSDIPSPAEALGFPLGQRTASHEQIVAAVRAMVDASDRASMTRYAETFEGRPLYYVVVSSPDNLARAEEIREGLAKLADPRQLSGADADAIIGDLPGVAWMGYSIHGNESSGADAALATLWHLLASTDESVSQLLEQLVVIIDPTMNPDGRARFIKSLEETRGAAPNVDDQSLLHRQYWPWGRGNHYLYDLNRDYILGVNPETRGKVTAINQWRPQMVIDGHEMFSQETYHFSPSSEPINRNRPEFLARWGNTFASEQAAEFDARQWPYFNGEYYDDLYPGYTTYSQYRGALNILYEQARFAEDGVRRLNGQVISYREAVHHHLVSTMTNLQSLAEHHQALYRDYLADRRQSVASDGPYARRSWVVLANGNQTRLDRLARVLDWQGFEFYVNDDELGIDGATNQLGERARLQAPPGSLVIPNRQPEARLLATMMEFDTEITEDMLRRERQSLLRDGDGLMYDTTAWNLGMMFGLETWTVASELGAGLDRWQAQAPAATDNDTALPGLGWLASGADDASVAFAARLMEQGVAVRVIDEATELAGQAWPRGSVAVLRYDNQPGNPATFDEQTLASLVSNTASTLNLPVTPLAGGTAPGAKADVGSHHFQQLVTPRIALVTRGSTSGYDYGSIWHSIDRHLGIRHSHLDRNTLAFTDLRRYNVLVLPDLSWGALGDAERQALKTWTQAGGTLIAVDDAIDSLVDAGAEFSQVRTLDAVFEELDEYELSLRREWLASQDQVDLEQVWSHTAPVQVDYPWQHSAKRDGKDELAQQDAWQARFMPSGAFVAARVDERHWLTSGTGAVLPVLVQNNPVLMSKDNSEAVLRLGVYREITPSVWQNMLAGADGSKDSDNAQVGWATLPRNHELRLRMSGLLWPEAAQRLANAAWVTRESVGSGQLILFAGQPAFRGASYGMTRLLLNALVYGPGMGTSQPIMP